MTAFRKPRGGFVRIDMLPDTLRSNRPNREDTNEAALVIEQLTRERVVLLVELRTVRRTLLKARREGIDEIANSWVTPAINRINRTIKEILRAYL